MVKVVDVDERLSAVAVHCNAITDPDVVCFSALTNAGDFDGAAQLCRERMLTARSPVACVRWTKDRAIVEAMRGNFTAAYDLLASVHWLASCLEGTPRGKYENEFGIVHARLGRHSLALGRFNIAYQHLYRAGAIHHCASVDTARARCLITRDELLKAHRYLNRALPVAERYADTLLCGEIDESRALAFEAQGLIRQARKMAAHSIYLLEGTPFAAALAESRATYDRLTGDAS